MGCSSLWFGLQVNLRKAEIRLEVPKMGCGHLRDIRNDHMLVRVLYSLLPQFLPRDAETNGTNHPEKTAQEYTVR